MLIVSRQILWPLGLLVIVSGCAGDRIRQTLHPDREFMQLSELEEYDRKHGKIHDDDAGTLGQFVSLSREKDEDGPAEQKTGFLNFKRLFGRDNDLPPDPFLVEEEANVADTDEGGADSKRKSAITIASSREIKESEEGDAEELILDDWVSKPSTSRPVADAKVAIASSGTGTSFADTLAEFEDEEAGDNAVSDDDEFDELARRLANEVAFGDVGDEFAGDQVDSSEFALSSDSPTTESTDDSRSIPRLPEDDQLLADIEADDLFGQDFEVMADAETADGLMPELPAFGDEELPLIADGLTGEETEPGFPFAETAESAATALIGAPTDHSASNVADAEFAHADSTETDSVFTDQPGLSLPEPAPEVFTGQDAEVASRPVSSLTTQEQLGASAQTAASAATRAESQPRITTAAPLNPMLSNQNCPVESMHVAPSAIVPSSIPPMAAGTNAFSSEPFLTDFQAQARAMQQSPAVAAAAYGRSGYSTKLWLMLLGSVVILYLLFAPEQKNPQESYNQ